MLIKNIKIYFNKKSTQQLQIKQPIINTQAN